MPPRFLADENFNGRILRGLERRVPDLPIARIQDIPEISGAEDSVVLEWAARQNRVILTHDVATMAGLAYERAKTGEHMPGVLEVHPDMPIGQAIEELELIVRAGHPDEWEGQVRFLPL